MRTHAFFNEECAALLFALFQLHFLENTKRKGLTVHFLNSGKVSRSVQFNTKIISRYLHNIIPDKNLSRFFSSDNNLISRLHDIQIHSVQTLASPDLKSNFY